MSTRAASRNVRIAGSSASARRPVLREIDAAASHTAISDVIGSPAASSSSANACASSSSVKSQRSQMHQRTRSFLVLVEAVPEFLGNGPGVPDPSSKIVTERCNTLPRRSRPPTKLIGDRRMHSFGQPNFLSARELADQALGFAIANMKSHRDSSKSHWYIRWRNRASNAVLPTGSACDHNVSNHASVRLECRRDFRENFGKWPICRV